MLFNKNNTGSEELNVLTGTYYASNQFDNIAIELEFAETELSSIIGKELIKRAAEYYLTDAYSISRKSKDDKLVRLVQMPIACLAVSRYFKQNIVSHEDTGRKVKVDANDKLAWEWMFDRDDNAIIEKYYRSLDTLYVFLEENKVEEWINADIRKSFSESIVKNINDFEKVYPIEHSYYTYFMLQPLIVEIQNTKLKPILSNSADNITETVMCHARRAAVLLAIVIAVQRWSVAVFPQNIARRFTPSYQGNKASNAAAMNEIEWYLRKLQEQAADALNEIINTLQGNNNPYADYPLLPENDKNNKYFNAGV